MAAPYGGSIQSETIMSGDHYSTANVDRAIDRLPSLATKDIRDQLDRATSRGIERLAEACRRELGLRPVEMNGDVARRHAETAERMRGMSLADVTRMAFTEQPPSWQELKILKVIAADPGITFAKLQEITAMRDLSLAVGHLAHDRFGFFRGHIEAEKDQSSVLILKDNNSPSVTYRLKPEVEAVLRDLGIV